MFGNKSAKSREKEWRKIVAALLASVEESTAVIERLTESTRESTASLKWALARIKELENRK